MGVIDLRSDTVTQPTDEMRAAMAAAPVGDDVFGEDPTINALESLAAEMVGKDAAVFVPSGTMGNLIAMMAHTQKGDAVILEAESHTYRFEVGGVAAVAGVLPIPLEGVRGYITPGMLRAAVRGPNIHIAPARLVCLENTHNRSGGTPFGPDEMDAVTGAAREMGLAVHLDGARIFNAAIACGVPAAALTRGVDSVMFCVSKALSAPVGSLVCGSRPFVERARRFRKMVGGGMRQAGIIAAAGIVALRTMVDRLAEDHENARRLGEELAGVQGLRVDPEQVRTNMVVVELAPPRSAGDVAERLRAEDVLVSVIGPAAFRLVTHRHITRALVDSAVASFRKVLAAA
jgi:threonine aldolase